MNIDPDELVHRLNSGKKLDKAELEEVVALIDGGLSEDKRFQLSLDDVYTLLLVLGKVRDPRHQHLLERYLDCKEPQTVTLAMEILCIEWKLTEEYLEQLVSFVLGQSWDDENDVQCSAAKILGEYLHTVFWPSKATKDSAEPQPRHSHIVQLLLQSMFDTDADYYFRKTAYYALCRAAGLDWEKIPSDFARLDLGEGSSDLDVEVISFCRKRSS